MPTPRRHDELIPAQPFRDWLETRIKVFKVETLDRFNTHSATTTLARRLNWSDRRLRRYRTGWFEVKIDGVRSKEFRTEYLRRCVEEALHQFGMELTQVYTLKWLEAERVKAREEFEEIKRRLATYEEMHDLGPFNGLGWCPTCEDRVTRATDLTCLWCDTPTSELHEEAA